MSKSQVDLILHPIRLKVITELSGRQMTPRQIGDVLPEVPQSTLYRHIKLLLDAGILCVVSTQMVNGSAEHTYGLVQGQLRLSDDNLHGRTHEEHLESFIIYLSSLIDDFGRFVSTADLNTLIEAGLSYQRAVIYLNDEERERFREEITGVVMRYAHLMPAEDRQRFILGSIVIPDQQKPE